MNVCIRADASVEIGTGHVMRCLTLAEQLRQKGANVFFISREHEGNLNDWIRLEKKFTVYSLKKEDNWEELSVDMSLYKRWLGSSTLEDATQTRDFIQQSERISWLIVDHYGIDQEWERFMRPYVDQIMVIDDLANRKHDCDVLLDQNLYEDGERRYKELVPPKCQQVIGPSFALLREEFLNKRQQIRKRTEEIKHILIFFGGADLTNETLKALQAVEMLDNSQLIIDVVVGKSNPNKNKIENYCRERRNIHFYCQVSDMATLMSKADLAIGAGGATTWERACLGLPSIMLAIADNQIELCQNVDRAGIVEYLGFHSQVDAKQIYEVLLKVLNNLSHLYDLRNRGRQLVDGKGTQRVVLLMEGYVQ